MPGKKAPAKKRASREPDAAAFIQISSSRASSVATTANTATTAMTATTATTTMLGQQLTAASRGGKAANNNRGKANPAKSPAAPKSSKNLPGGKKQQVPSAQLVHAHIADQQRHHHREGPTTTVTTTTSSTTRLVLQKNKLKMQSFLNRWLTDATPLVETWIALGLRIPPHCKRSSSELAAASVASSSSSSSLLPFASPIRKRLSGTLEHQQQQQQQQFVSHGNSNVNNNNVDHARFLHFLTTQLPTGALTVAKTAVQDAVAVWSDTRTRLHENTAAGDQFALALKACSSELLSDQEKLLLSKCAQVFDIALPTALPSDFSFAIGVERGVRTAAAVERLINAAKLMEGATSRLQKAILASVRKHDQEIEREQQINVQRGDENDDDATQTSSTKISLALLSNVGCDEVNTITPHKSAVKTSSNDIFLRPDGVGSNASVHTKSSSATAAASNHGIDTLTQPVQHFPLLNYSSHRGAGVTFVSGVAMHRRNGERQRVLLEAVARVVAGDGLPLYMRAASKNIAVTSTVPTNTTAVTQNSSSGVALRRHHPNKVGALGFMPDLTDLPSDQFTVQNHCMEQIAREVSGIVFSNVTFELFIGEPHDVLRAVQNADGDADEPCGCAFSFEDLPLRVPLSLPASYYAEDVVEQVPHHHQNQQQQQQSNNDAATTTAVTKPEDDSAQKQARDSAGGAATATTSTNTSVARGSLKVNFMQKQRQEQQEQLKREREEAAAAAAEAERKRKQEEEEAATSAKQRASTNAAAATAAPPKRTRAEKLIQEMYRASNANEHRVPGELRSGRCFGIVVGQCKSGGDGAPMMTFTPGRRTSTRTKAPRFIAGVVELQLTLAGEEL